MADFWDARVRTYVVLQNILRDKWFVHALVFVASKRLQDVVRKRILGRYKINNNGLVSCERRPWMSSFNWPWTARNNLLIAPVIEVPVSKPVLKWEWAPASLRRRRKQNQDARQQLIPGRLSNIIRALRFHKEERERGTNANNANKFRWRKNPPPAILGG